MIFKKILYNLLERILFIFFIYSFFFFSFLVSLPTYRIQHGDSYFLIAKKLKIKPQELISLNKNKPLRKGMVIDIPSHFYYLVKKNDSLLKIAYQFQFKLRFLEKVNNYPKTIYVGQRILIPLSYQEYQLKISKKNTILKKEVSLKTILKNITDNNPEIKRVTNILKDSQDKHNNTFLKIKLDLPLRVRVKKKNIKFYEEKDGIYNFGTFFSARNNNVFPVYKGNVVFCGLVRGIGKTVILVHQKKIEKQVKYFYTVYGNLSLFNSDYFQFSKNLKNNYQVNITLTSRDVLGKVKKKLFFAIFFENDFWNPKLFF